MSREEMINNIVNKFGHEDNRTILFCGLCEDYPDNEFADTLILVIYNGMMNGKWE